jgi:hypothetical protein
VKRLRKLIVSSLNLVGRSILWDILLKKCVETHLVYMEFSRQVILNGTLVKKVVQTH